MTPSAPTTMTEVMPLPCLAARRDRGAVRAAIRHTVDTGLEAQHPYRD
ncbi:hypothetical protein [Streptomyces sp. NBC_00996]|nr:hypothetical protein OG390_41810 [Streptomyces sp. NBC_00996]